MATRLVFKMSSAESSISGFSTGTFRCSGSVLLMSGSAGLLVRKLLAGGKFGFDVVGFGEERDRLNIGGFAFGEESSTMLPGDIFLS
jgi:hypothetical protein